jgi:hypothetical protein
MQKKNLGLKIKIAATFEVYNIEIGSYNYPIWTAEHMTTTDRFYAVLASNGSYIKRFTSFPFSFSWRPLPTFISFTTDVQYFILFNFRPSLQFRWTEIYLRTFQPY